MDGGGGGSILSVAASSAGRADRGLVADGEAGRGNGVMEHSVIRYRSINTKYTTADDDDDFDRRMMERTPVGLTH